MWSDSKPSAPRILEEFWEVKPDDFGNSFRSLQEFHCRLLLWQIPTRKCDEYQRKCHLRPLFNFIASYSWCFSIGILPEKYTVGIPLSKAASFRQLCQIWIKNDAFATISRRNWEKHLKYLAKKILCMNWMICSILRKSA